MTLFHDRAQMKRLWTKEEDAILVDLISKHGKQWGVISSQFPDRNPAQVAARWEKCLDPAIHKGPFTPEEDQLIVNYVSQQGPRSWPHITALLPNRSAKQCRERWFNHLDPSLMKSEWTQHEDELIFQQYQTLGTKWSVIAKLFPGRSDNAIKNRWNSSIAKRIQIDSQGMRFVLPDSSKRKYKSKARPSPVPMGQVSPPVFPVDKKKAPPKLEIPLLPSPSPTIPFSPFTLPTPSFPGVDIPLFAAGSPLAGLQLSPSGFGGLPSPKALFLLSPTKKEEAFK
jgi:hypothetical protein